MPQTTTMPVAAVITGSAHDYDSLLELIGDAQAVEPLDRTSGWEG